MVDRTEKHPFWEQAAFPLPGTAITPQEYDALPETNIRIELVDGVIIYPNLGGEDMSPTPRPDHQLLIGSLFSALRPLIPTGQLVLSPMEVRMADAVRVQPDLFWVAANSRCEARDTHYAGPPDLIIEVLSPSTARHDKTVKFLLYERYGVPEYWIADVDLQQIEVWRLVDGVYSRVGVFGRDDRYAPPLFDGAALDLDAVFGD